ncbi:hypothetical protein ABT034_13845 [Streptomyces sp. NPDC002773]|uniref:hypothetical protein n=1 Tax=Streptomyces sp. NPDC002773 TaxID=3154430 RepID=UPI00332874F1
MDWYVVIPSALALLLVLSGVAALRTGWIVSWQRRRVFRPAPYGWGQLAIATAFVLQAVGQLVGDRATRAPLGVAVVLGLLGGLVLLVLAQRPRQDR